MHISIYLITFVISSAYVHSLDKLPSFGIQITLLLIAVICFVYSGLFKLIPRLSVSSSRPIKIINSAIMLIAISLIGFSNTVIRADIRLNDNLAQSNVDLVTRAKVVVTSLPQYKNGVLRFDAKILESTPLGVPENIQIKWAEPKWHGPYAVYSGKSAIPTVKPGHIWKIALVLKPVSGLYNLGGFDYEQSMFAKNIRAMGTVRGKPKFISDEPSFSFNTYVQRWRYRIKINLEKFLQSYPKESYANMILALSIGDQASINQSQWQVFSRTGITHLVSISGTHVSIISAIAAMLAYAFWTSIRFKNISFTEYLPSQIASACFALLVAWFYCLLAGWGIPAQRTFFMLAVLVVIYISNIKISSINTLLLVAVVITALDPWAVLSNGFWLSFIAVGVLIAVAKSVPKGHVKSKKYLYTKWRSFVYANKLQIIITLALIPVLGLLFNQVSLISPVVNAYAITIVSLVITPLSLLSALLSCSPKLDFVTDNIVKLNVYLIDLVMQPTQYLSSLKFAVFDMASVPWQLIVLSVIGVVYAMLPKGVPHKHIGWFFIFPILIWQSKKPNFGDWELYALDVGQAAAVLIKTKNHNILFDAGNRNSIDSDSAQSVILPLIRYLGIKKIDAVVISHADLDHIGGLRSVLSYMYVKQIFTSFDLSLWLEQEAKKLKIKNNLPKTNTGISYCKNNLAWNIDGVEFKFVWPDSDLKLTKVSSKQHNAQSCVLSINGKYHSILLTGDINKAEETKIVNKGLKKHDIVFAAHHGSNGSSGEKFIKATNAKHAIVQVGALNRYNHPHPQVIKRWEKHKVKTWRSDKNGMIIAKSNNGFLQIDGLRQNKSRYWHTINQF